MKSGVCWGMGRVEWSVNIAVLGSGSIFCFYLAFI